MMITAQCSQLTDSLSVFEKCPSYKQYLLWYYWHYFHLFQHLPQVLNIYSQYSYPCFSLMVSFSRLNNKVSLMVSFSRLNNKVSNGQESMSCDYFTCWAKEKSEFQSLQERVGWEMKQMNSLHKIPENISTTSHTRIFAKLRRQISL